MKSHRSPSLDSAARYDRIRFASFVSTCHVTSGRNAKTANSRSNISSGTHSPKTSVMSPTNTRLPLIAFGVSIARTSLSSRYGVSFDVVGPLNGPPLPYRFASVSA